MFRIDTSSQHVFLPLYLIWISLVIAFGFSLWQAQWSTVFIVLATLLLTFLPIFLQKRYHIHIPQGFLVAIVFFIYASIFLGEVQGFYERFWWWDILLHTGSAIGFGLIGFVILLLLYKTAKVNASPIILSIFAFTFAVAIGALWEIFEFSMDFFFGFSMQKFGLKDTMLDLTVDSVGALTASMAGYFYLARKTDNILTRFIREAVKQNTYSRKRAQRSK